MYLEGQPLLFIFNTRIMNISLKGKVGLVTGGTKGIGKAIADRLSKAGAQVVVIARNAPKDKASEHHFIAADLTLPESAEIIAKEFGKYGTIDIIVNNAGANLSPGGGFSTLLDEHWYNDWQLNFMSVVRLNKALLPAMINQQSGVIVHISTGACKTAFLGNDNVLFFGKGSIEYLQQSAG